MPREFEMAESCRGACKPNESTHKFLANIQQSVRCTERLLERLTGMRLCVLEDYLIGMRLDHVCESVKETCYRLRGGMHTM